MSLSLPTRIADLYQMASETAAEIIGASSSSPNEDGHCSLPAASSLCTIKHEIYDHPSNKAPGLSAASSIIGDDDDKFADDFCNNNDNGSYISPLDDDGDDTSPRSERSKSDSQLLISANYCDERRSSLGRISPPTIDPFDINRRRNSMPPTAGRFASILPNNKHLHMNKTNNSNKSNSSRRHRTTFSSHQIRCLEETFGSTQYPNGEFRRQLSRLIGVSDARIQIWFQNRRAKSRRRSSLANHSQLSLFAATMNQVYAQKTGTEDKIDETDEQQQSDDKIVIKERAESNLTEGSSADGQSEATMSRSFLMPLIAKCSPGGLSHHQSQVANLIREMSLRIALSAEHSRLLSTIKSTGISCLTSDHKDPLLRFSDIEIDSPGTESIQSYFQVWRPWEKALQQ